MAEQTAIKEATVEQLKVTAFDIDNNIKQLQNNYQQIIIELNKRQAQENKENNKGEIKDGN